MPVPTEAELQSFKHNFDLTQADGKRKIFSSEMGAYIGPQLGKPYNELLRSGDPYLVLDSMVCHLMHQRKGVTSLLLAHGGAEARKLGSKKIFVMTSTDLAGTRFYESRGFKTLRTVSLVDSKWGGTAPHVTSFLEKEV